MLENKYGKVLTIILIVVIIAIIALLSFLGYDVYQKFAVDKAAATVVDEFEESISNSISDEDTDTENIIGDDTPVTPILNEEVTETTNSSTGEKKVTYKGYNVVGTIEIPAINLKYPVLERVTPDSIELSVAMLMGPGLNEIGNTVIVGHNYRNGSFFGSNDKLVLGDKVYITDTSGRRIQYNIYNIYNTTPDDADYAERDTNGKREISLSTCSDNSKSRLVIWAVEE